MTKIKLWISDIDGTIMNYDGSVTSRMENLISRINNSETKFVLATGRMFMGANHAAKRFNINTPVVCYQGAIVRTKDEILWQSPIKDDLIDEILSYLRKYNIHTNLYSNDILYVEDDDKRIMEEYCSGRGTTYKVVKSFDEVEKKDIPKILGIIYDKDLMQKVKTELSEMYKGVLTIVQSSPMYLEITDINASKGNALNFLKKYWNIKDEEIIASGDQDNDIEMLKCAGIKVSVGSNSERIKNIATYNCKDVNSDELVDLIERLVFCG